MALILTARWVFFHLIRNPLTWLWVLLVVSVWPLTAALTPLGHTTADGTPTAQLYDVAFLALLAGTCAGLGVLSQWHWFLAPLTALRRTAVEAVGLGASALLVLALTLGVAAAIGTPLHSALFAGAALSALHVVSVALLLLRFRASSTARLLALPVVVWVLPALLATMPAPGPALARILAASEHLAFSSASLSAQAHRGMAVLPIIGLGIAALLLSRSDAIRRPG